MDNKIKGVNLGGWLVLEKWMSPSLFTGTNAEDEYYLPQTLSTEEYRGRISTHRGTFITEADFLRIASEGFNLVRIPVPYFIFGDRANFIGCIDELDKAFSWAQAYGLKVLIDLHTAPFSQNGFDNGGISGVCRWAQIPEEVDFELSVLVRLAERYKNHEALWGIEVINEPILESMWETMNPLERYPARDKKMASGSGPITFEFLADFYLTAYQKLRPILPTDKVIVFHDGFDLHGWKTFFEIHEFSNVMLDTHQYVMVAELFGTEQSIESYVDYLSKLGEEIAEVSEYVTVFVGEWSLFNSYTAGVDTKGGINPTQEEFHATNRLSEKELQEAYRTLWNGSVAAWNQGAGYVYRTYKLNIDTINEPAWYGWDSWDLNRCLMKKWVDLSEDK